MRILVAFTVSFLLSCQSKKESTAKVEFQKLQSDTSSFANKKNSLSFFDSLSAKYCLTIEQIKSHSKIDSIYYTNLNSEVSFTGDTILAFQGSLKGAIIDYDDRKNCIYKFLLIFDSTNQNIGDKIIYTDCDVDASTGHKEVSYKLMNNSTFMINETYFSPNNKSKEVKKTTWQIKNPGKTGSCFKLVSFNTEF